MIHSKLRIIINVLFLLVSFQNLLAKDYKLTSPDGTVILTIAVNDKITYTLIVDGKQVMDPSLLSMTLDNNIILGENPKVLKKAKDQLTKYFTHKYKLKVKKF